eukprot:ctg_1306.g461
MPWPCGCAAVGCDRQHSAETSSTPRAHALPLCLSRYPVVCVIGAALFVGAIEPQAGGLQPLDFGGQPADPIVVQHDDIVGAAVVQALQHAVPVRAVRILLAVQEAGVQDGVQAMTVAEAVLAGGTAQHVVKGRLLGERRPGGLGDDALESGHGGGAAGHPVKAGVGAPHPVGGQVRGRLVALHVQRGGA